MDGAEKADVLRRLNRQLHSAVVPHNTALALTAVDVGDDFATVELPYAEHLVGNPMSGVLHGGAITSLLDATCGLGVFARLKTGDRIATLDLRIDYLRPATPPKNVYARAECYRLARSIAFVRALAYHEDPEDPIAAGVGTFMIFRDAKSPLGMAINVEDES